MKMPNKLIVSCAFLIFIFSGCATPLQPNQTKITISSNPPGATISNENNSVSDVEPLDLVWTLAPGKSTAISGLVTARWVSGATAQVKLSLTAGKSQTYTINRPNVPGIDADIKWAIHLKEQNKGSGLAGALDSYYEGRYGKKSGQNDRLKADCSPNIGGGFSCF